MVMAYQKTYRDVKRNLKSHWYNQMLSHEISAYRSLRNETNQNGCLENSDPLKNDRDFKRSSTWMIIGIFC